MAKKLRQKLDPTTQARRKPYQRPVVVEEEVFDRRLLTGCPKADDECSIIKGGLAES